MKGVKPCPFCGYDLAITWHVGHFTKPWVVECCGCAAQGPHGYDEKEAVELWNKRTVCTY